MKKYIYKKIDAFASGASTGNPAACLYLKKDETLTPAAMLDIAKQHKGFVSEVVYCFGRELHYYSSECEVDFCGHGTIACTYELIKNTPELLVRETVEFQTHMKGMVTVHNRIADQDAVYITAPEPVHIGTSLGVADVAASLGFREDEINTQYPLDLIDAGLRTLLVPVRELSALTCTFPDMVTLKSFCENNNIDIVLIHCFGVDNPDSFAHTRVFAPRFGYLEDPATGSGNSAFGYYLLKNKLWNGSAVSIEQGGSDRVFNTVKLTTDKSKVLFGGGAITRIEGHYFY